MDKHMENVRDNGICTVPRGIPYEFADIIPDSEFVSVLFLPATEYAVNLIIPMSVLPEKGIDNVGLYLTCYLGDMELTEWIFTDISV